MQILAGDIGGTNTRLIWSGRDDTGKRITIERTYPSANYVSLIQVIEVFLSELSITHAIDAACFAIAGPVELGTAVVTNLPWKVSEKELSSMLSASGVKLINDFVAVAHGISDLQNTDMLVLQEGITSDNVSGHLNAAVIGAGTGFGASHRVWMDNQYQVFSSEVGHTSFAPENAEQSRLLAWLQKRHSHVSLEMLLSGNGLVTIHHFLHEVMGLHDSLIITDTMENIDPAQIIAEQALSGNDIVCEKALDIFIEIYGAAASNVALHYYPVQELYIAGGIAPKIKDKMSGSLFINAFLNKGPMSENMKKITIKLINQDRVGLYGALAKARVLYS